MPRLAQPCFLCVNLIMISHKLSKFKILSLCDLRLQTYRILYKFIRKRVWQHFYLIFWFDLTSYHIDVHFLNPYNFWFHIFWYITIFCRPMGTSPARVPLYCALLFCNSLLKNLLLVKLLFLKPLLFGAFAFLWFCYFGFCLFIFY